VAVYLAALADAGGTFATTHVVRLAPTWART